MVEFALILPVMLLLVAAAVDLGRLFYAYVAIENAAKEGALYGAKHPLCADNTNVNCSANGANVQYYVENEAASGLKNALGTSLLTTGVTCRAKTTGTVRQPVNDCLDGDTYQVKVTYDFRLVTPILSNILGTTITLSSTQESTVLADAFDPAGLEVLVWADSANADNGTTVAAACQPADTVNAPGYFYAPCQDLTNVDNYLQFKEGTTVSYKVRVRNTGNIGLSAITYQFSTNGTNTVTPGTCSTLPATIAKGAAPSFCTFTSVVTASTFGALNDYTIGVSSTAQASGLATGTTNGAGVVKVVPRPRLAVNVWASPYRLGGTGNGLSGVASYPVTDLSMFLDAASGEPTVRQPTGWLYISVANQGGTASNLSLGVNRNGTPISLTACGTIPTSLATYGTTGDTYTCIVPVSFTAIGAFTFQGTATATNSLTVSGTHPSVGVTVGTCTAGLKVVPNVVDTLSPSADGTTQQVSQSKNTWQNAGFNNANYTTNPAGASGSAKVTSQSVSAYSCAAATASVTVTAP
jgi:Flp pilus assembly protein TadG